MYTAASPAGTKNITNNMNSPSPAHMSQQPRKPRRPAVKKQQPPSSSGDDDQVGRQPIRRNAAGPSNTGGNNSKNQHIRVHKPNGGPPVTKQPQKQQPHQPTTGGLACDESMSESQSITCGGSMSGSLAGDTVATTAPSTPTSFLRAPGGATMPAGAVSPVPRSPVRRNIMMTTTTTTTNKSNNVYINHKPPASPMRKPPSLLSSSSSSVGDRSVGSQGNKAQGHKNRSPSVTGGINGSSGSGSAGGGAPLSPRRQPRRSPMDPSSNSSSNSTGNNNTRIGPQSANLNSPGKKRIPIKRTGPQTSGPPYMPPVPLTPNRRQIKSGAAVKGEESTWMAFEPDQWPETPVNASDGGGGGSCGDGGSGGYIASTPSVDHGGVRPGSPLARRKPRRPIIPHAAAGENSSPPSAAKVTSSLKAKLDSTGGFRPSLYFNSNIEGLGSMGEPSLSLYSATTKSPKSSKQGHSVLSSRSNISAMEKKEQGDRSTTGPASPATTTTTNSNSNVHNNNTTNTATPGNPNGVYIMPTTQTKLYEYARNCQWDDVTRELQQNPRDAKCVGEKDGTTALHLAVMSRSNPMMRDGKMGEEYQSAPISLIELLINACPEAAIIRCARKRYTPLSYACLVADRGYSMDDAAEMVEILLKHAPDSAFVFTDDGFSALDVHILSYSRLHKQKEEVYSGGRTSTVVLRTLLAQQPSLAEARVYRNKIRGPIELLYRCNTQEFRDALEEETGLVDDAVLIAKKKKQRFGSVMSVLTDWWAWKWALVLLKFASLPGNKPGTMFQAVHAAARMVGCPLPIIALAVNTFPLQVTERDPRNDLYNLPLHEVCSWRCDQENVAGDPLIASRKFKAIQCLVEEFPDATRMTNNMGETPLQLAIETCTPWHGGLELLVEACPKALKFPRKLRRDGDAGYSISVQNHSALASVNSFDTDRTDPMLAMEGMYPFLIAAVLGGVAPHKQRAPVSYSNEMAREHEINLQKKSLQSVRSIFGLLRARPQLLQKYRETVTQEFLKMREEEDEEECSAYDDVEYDDEEYDDECNGEEDE